MNIFNLLDKYFENDTAPIPPELLDPKVSNPYLVKLLALRYIIHPLYIRELNKYYNQDGYTFYAIDVEQFLKHCKLIILSNKIDIQRWKRFIKKLPKEFNETTEFKEFATEFPKRMNDSYSKEDLIFIYTILSDKDRSLFSPTLRKRIGAKKRVTKKERKEFEERFKSCKCEKIESFRDKLNHALEKKSLDVCQLCELKPNQSVGFDFLHNRKTDCDIDIVFVGMNPYVDEIKEGKPFVGKSGKYLRQYINKYFNDKNIVITNSVMCFIENNGDPSKETIARCHDILETQLRFFNPKVIVPLGKLAISAITSIDISKPFSEIRKHTIKSTIGEYIAVPTMHPSGIIRSLNKYGTVYDEDFTYIKNLIEEKPQQQIKQYSTINIKYKEYKLLKSKQEVFTLIQQGYKVINAQEFQYVDKNSKEYKVIDVKCFATLKDKNDQRYYFDIAEYPYEYFVCVKQENEGIRPIEDISSCKKEEITIKQHLEDRWGNMKVKRQRLFEGDVSPANKFINELKIYAQQQGFETKTHSILHADRVGYLDIEVSASEGFTKPENPTQPVIMFAYSDNYMDEIIIATHKDYYKNNKAYTHESNVLKDYIDSEVYEKYGKDIKYRVIVLENEFELFQFLELLIVDRQLDVLTAWNAWYDFNYLFNRSELQGYGITLSPIGIKGYISSRTGLYKAPGVEILDMIEVYKSTKRGELPSYKLDFVANLELNVGKVAYEGDINQLFQDPVKATIYNMIDVFLIKLLDSKKRLFESKFTQRILQGCSLEGMLDNVVPFTNILIRQARTMKKCIRSTQKHTMSESYTGAYTRAFKTGIVTLVVDYDQSVTGDMIVTIKRNNAIFDTSIQEYQYEVGDEVLTLDIDNKSVVFKEVLDKIEHHNKHKILEIELENGDTIKVTNNHSVFVKTENGDMVLKNASELSIGDELINTKI